MGVVKEDFTVTGLLPSTKAVAVHYPGYPSSISRAIETLGGGESIPKLKELKLRFRPEANSHPTIGQLLPCNNFLLKLSKKRITDGQTAQLSEARNSDMPVSQPERESVISTTQVEAQGSEDDQYELCADIVARVPKAYYFEGMADYQHVLPVQTEVSFRKKRKLSEMEELPSGMDVDQKDVMALVPQMFSPKDLPEEIVLQPPHFNSKNKQEVVQNAEEMYFDRGFVIDCNVKEIPQKLNAGNHICPEEWDMHIVLCELFEERPIWPKVSLLERCLDKGLKVECRLFRRLLAITTYYFSKGPFNRFLIKRGYDPRLDPDSRKYQKVDFRVPAPLRSYCDSNATTELKHRWEDICAFRIFPRTFHISFITLKSQVGLQLCELDDKYIQEKITEPLEEATFSNETGWFSKILFEILKKHVKLRFLKAYGKAGPVEALIVAKERKKAAKDLERYKYTMLNDAVKKHVDQQNRRESKEKEDEAPKNISDRKDIDEIDNEDVDVDVDEDEDDDEDDEDEEEEEEEEEEPDDDSSLQSKSYLDSQNFSKTHLQGLFGSFPSTVTDDGKVQDDETSDGEYHIYEQDSDDNADDDHGR